jgi:hypothetical protein
MIDLVNNYLNGNRFNQLEFGNIQTANFTLEQNKINLIDTSASLSGLNAMLPIGMIAGTKINITDAKNSFSPEKPLTILNSGYRINGNLDDFQIPIGKSSITFLAIDDGGVELNWILLDSIPIINEFTTRLLCAEFVRTSNSAQGTGDIDFIPQQINEDTHSIVNISTGIIAIPKSGYYLIDHDVHMNGTFSAGQNNNIKIVNSDNSYIKTLGSVMASGNYSYYSSGSVRVKLAQGQHIKIRASRTSSIYISGSTTVGAAQSRISITELR